MEILFYCLLHFLSMTSKTCTVLKVFHLCNPIQGVKKIMFSLGKKKLNLEICSSYSQLRGLWYLSPTLHETCQHQPGEEKGASHSDIISSYF